MALVDDIKDAIVAGRAKGQNFPKAVVVNRTSFNALRTAIPSAGLTEFFKGIDFIIREDDDMAESFAFNLHSV